MEHNKILIDRFVKLPEPLQFQVLDFIEFLITKYNLEEEHNKEDNILTNEQKEILDQRLADSKKHPEKRIDWDKFKIELQNRYKPKKINVL
ncbi:MAG: DUF2281 domain-containing protein [Leptospiraceae bacterium]|nr:DUF2281 domain-containing protein [Leptospiraceae bacterium]MCP5496384.1 DUF2281 domain-containing protein [Leptospiraceae bacterium]